MVLRSKTKLGLEIGFSIFVVILVFALIFMFSRSENIEEVNFCQGKSVSSGFSIDACFDVLTKNIFLDVRRGSFSSYELRAIGISFVEEGVLNSFNLSSVPETGEFKTYNFPAMKNPSSANLFFYFGDESFEDSCIEENKIFVGNCVRDVDDSPKNLLDNNSLNYYSYNEDYWRNICASDWSCSDWGECLGGIERRECIDLNKCDVPVDIPRENRYCSQTCVEDWSCTWSSCSQGFSEPSCVDLNSCGTSFNKPKKAICFEGASCSPSISCEEFSECSVDYSFLDYEDRLNFNDIKGKRTRVCSDSNSCVASFVDSEECITNLDVYTKTVNKCGFEYVEVYSSLGNELLVRMKNIGNDLPLQIIFGDLEISC